MDEAFVRRPSDSSWCDKAVFLTGVVTLSRSMSANTQSSQLHCSHSWNQQCFKSLWLAKHT